MPIGVVAGWTSAPSLRPHLEPRHPPPQRGAGAAAQPDAAAHAFKLAAVWLLAVGLLFAVGLPTAALVLGGVLVAVCGLVTATNFCIPSTLLGSGGAAAAAHREAD